MARYSGVVDDDIDPANLHEVMWAVATRSDPATSIDIIQRGMGSKNDPMYVTYSSSAPFSSKAIIDACRPFEWIRDFPPVSGASKELKQQVLEKYGRYLKRIGQCTGITRLMIAVPTPRCRYSHP